MADEIVSLEVAVFSLIKRYIERQEVTLEAFRALRPALIEADHIDCDEKKLVEILTKYMDEPWQGHWHEWSYYFQGSGCRLISGETAEIIEWEATDVQTFDRYWFVNWLEWLWMFHPNDSDLRLLRDFFSHRPNRYDLYEIIFPMLNILSIEGYIKQHDRHKNRYKVVDKKQSLDVA